MAASQDDQLSGPVTQDNRVRLVLSRVADDPNVSERCRALVEDLIAGDGELSELSAPELSRLLVELLQ